MACLLDPTELCKIKRNTTIYCARIAESGLIKLADKPPNAQSYHYFSIQVFTAQTMGELIAKIKEFISQWTKLNLNLDDFNIYELVILVLHHLEEIIDVPKS